MQDLVDKSGKPGELVVDLFCGTLVTERAYLELPGNNRFMGCEVDAECIAAST